jgi:hypothetical protein
MRVEPYRLGAPVDCLYGRGEKETHEGGAGTGVVDQRDKRRDFCKSIEKKGGLL